MIAAPELLALHHDIQSFDCGRASLNDWLRKKAFKAQQVVGSARTYVVCAAGGRVIGYSALATGSIARSDAAGKVRRNMPDPIPVIVIARLAVDQSYTGQGIGVGLLKDALMRVAVAAEQIGVRAVLVHALDEAAREFYLKQGFYPSPSDEMAMMVTVEEVLATLGS